MNRVPVFVRAIIAGLIVTAAASVPWGMLVQANLRCAPHVPWAAATMAGYLFLYWKYLGGWGWPRFTAAARRNSMRAVGLSLRVWGWSLLSGISAFAASLALLLVVRRMVAWPAQAGQIPADLSALVIVATLLISALVAGVSEEAGFRGYMQHMMEGRYGAPAAIFVCSIVFGLAHLTHGLRLLPLLFDAGWGALYGILAYVSGSIVPGILLHSGLDFIEFLMLWKRAPRLRPLIWQSGPDITFWCGCAATVIFALIAFRAFHRLAVVARR